LQLDNANTWSFPAYVPAGHVTPLLPEEVEPAAQIWPYGHGCGDRDPKTQKNPAGHVTQGVAVKAPTVGL